MGKTYQQTVFSDKLDRNPQGDSKFVMSLMSPLEQVCIEQNGLRLHGMAELGHEDSNVNANNDQYARETYEFLVGKAYVTLCVDLFNGNKTAKILTEKGLDVTEIVNGLGAHFTKEPQLHVNCQPYISDLNP